MLQFVQMWANVYLRHDNVPSIGIITFGSCAHLNDSRVVTDGTREKIFNFFTREIIWVFSAGRFENLFDDADLSLSPDNIAASVLLI